MPRRPLARALVTLAATIATVLAGVLVPAAAQAAPAVHFAALGDSYSSGGTPWIRDISGVIEAYHPNANGYRHGYLAALTAATS